MDEFLTLFKKFAFLCEYTGVVTLSAVQSFNQHVFDLEELDKLEIERFQGKKEAARKERDLEERVILSDISLLCLRGFSWYEAQYVLLSQASLRTSLCYSGKFHFWEETIGCRECENGVTDLQSRRASRN